MGLLLVSLVLGERLHFSLGITVVAVGQGLNFTGGSVAVCDAALNANNITLPVEGVLYF